LQQAAAGFREECSSLEQLVEQLYSDIERLGAELEVRADELDEGRRHLAERGRQLAEQRKESARLSHQLEQQETQLADALKEIRDLRTQLTQPREGVTEDVQIQLLRQQIAQLQVERAVLAEKLESAGPPREGSDASAAALSSQAIASLAEQFADLKQHLQTSSSHLADAVEQAAQRAIASLPPPVIPEASAHPGSEDQSAKLADLFKERIELEAELELVRARSAELQETVARQQREISEQRTDVSEELRGLRKLIEEQALLVVHGEGAPSAEQLLPSPDAVRPAHSASHAEHAKTGAAADPMVSSVMAQFAKLQKDIAQRRKKK
jgi:DNA repair exonuclease SbcCD ATPase subunit